MRQDNIVALVSQAAATLSSAAIPALNLFQCSVQFNVTGSAAGTGKLQGSNDVPAVGAPTHWSDIPSATISVSGAGSFLIPKTDLCYQWVRVVYTNTGTGTVEARFKALGA